MIEIGAKINSWTYIGMPDDRKRDYGVFQCDDRQRDRGDAALLT